LHVENKKKTKSQPPKIIGTRLATYKKIFMKQGVHPENYRLVVFRDMSNGHSFLSRSTAASKETVKWEDGNEYPVIKLEISNTSHPFYTGKNMLVDTAGRIDKFKKRYAKK
jgi:large subunit ribosomal protein L31